jgi:hypothetical protein
MAYVYVLLVSALDGGGWSAHASAALLLGIGMKRRLIGPHYMPERRDQEKNSGPLHIRVHLIIIIIICMV